MPMSSKERIKCGSCNSNIVEMISPPDIAYQKHMDYPYNLRVSIPVTCGVCQAIGSINLVETGDGLIQHANWINDTNHKAYPVKEWPKILEQKAVQWALDMETDNASST